MLLPHVYPRHETYLSTNSRAVLNRRSTPSNKHLKNAAKLQSVTGLS